MKVNIGDVPVYYEEYGTGRPVLCLHGYSVDHRLMTGCLEPVFQQAAGYRRLYPDLPGMGRTPADRQIQNSDDMLALLREFIRQTIGDTPFLLAGESYGGYLSLGLIDALLQQISGALLLCPAVTAKKEGLPQKLLVWQSQSFSALERDADLDAFLSMAAVATPEILDTYKKDILSGVRTGDKKFLSAFSAHIAFADEDKLASLRFDKPSCILTGRQDHVVGYRDAYKLLDRFARATFAVLDSGGHNLQIETVSLFEQFVLDWLKRVARQ